jgi:anti-anti-sigma regulatory factor
MWWRRKQAEPDDARPLDPIVLAVTRPLTLAVADELSLQASRLASRHRVVIDLTAIPAFDTDGAFALARLQERLGSDVVTVVGMRQAAARLTGVGAAPDATLDTTLDTTLDPVSDQSGWVIRRLRNLAVVQDGGGARADDLDAAVNTALAEEVMIVVLDLREVELTRAGVDAVAFASSAAAVRGQELLVVNVDAAAAERLRAAGLSATTYVAPEA